MLDDLQKLDLWIIDRLFQPIVDLFRIERLRLVTMSILLATYPLIVMYGLHDLFEFYSKPATWKPDWMFRRLSIFFMVMTMTTLSGFIGALARRLPNGLSREIGFIYRLPLLLGAVLFGAASWIEGGVASISMFCVLCCMWHAALAFIACQPPPPLNRPVFAGA